jgi:hypothetical protein
MSEGLCAAPPRRSNRKRERTETFLDLQNEAFKAAEAVAAAAAAAADAAVTGFSSGLSTIQSMIDSLSIIPVSWNQRQLEQLLNAPLPGNRKHKMGDSNLRTSLSSDAQKECNNTGLYSWPSTIVSSQPEHFSPAYYYGQNICYMTFCFFSEKGGIWNPMYPQPPQNPLPAFAATYDRTNASHANSLTDPGQANVLVRLECEHVVPFDEMLFYFGCASNKWWEIYDKVLKEISEHRYKIKIAGSPRNSEWDILKEEGSKEYIKGMQSLVYDYSVALANQLKSDNRIINISYDGKKLSINQRDDYAGNGGLLDHIFKGTQLPLGMSCPHTGPWLDGVNQICINNMRGVYDDLYFYVPAIGAVPLRDLQLEHIDSIKGASKILLDKRCTELQILANNGSDGRGNYPIFQKLFVNVIIQAIIELSKIIDLSTLKAEHAEYLRYMQIYRQSMGLPDVLNDFIQKPHIMLTSDKERAEMIAALNNVAPPPAAAAPPPAVSNLQGGVRPWPSRSTLPQARRSHRSSYYKSWHNVTNQEPLNNKRRRTVAAADASFDPAIQRAAQPSGNQTMLTDAFKKILSPQRTKYNFPDDSAYSTDDKEALLQLDASKLAKEFITEHGHLIESGEGKNTFLEELPQLMELFLGKHLFEETLFGLEELLYSPIRGENSEALVDVLEIFFQIDDLRIIPLNESQQLGGRVKNTRISMKRRSKTRRSKTRRSKTRRSKTRRSKTRRKNTRRSKTRRSMTRRKNTRRNKTRRSMTSRKNTRRNKTRRKNTRRSKTR